MKCIVALSIFAICLFGVTSAAPVPPVTDITSEVLQLFQAYNYYHQVVEFLQTSLQTPSAQLKQIAAKTSGKISDAATKLHNELELLNTSLTTLLNSIKKSAATIYSIAEFVKKNAGKLNQDEIDSLAVLSREFISKLNSYNVATTKLQIIQQISAVLQSMPSIATASQETIMFLANKLDENIALVSKFRANIPESSLAMDNVSDSIAKLLACSTDVNATLKSIINAISSGLYSKIVTDTLNSIDQISAPVAVPSIDLIAVMNLMRKAQENLINVLTYVQSLLKSAMAQVKQVSNQSTGILREAADNLYKELEKLYNTVGAFIATSPKKIAVIEKIVDSIKNNAGKLSQETIDGLAAMVTYFVTVADYFSSILDKLQIIKPIGEALLQASQPLVAAPADVIVDVANQIDIIRGLIANVNANIATVPSNIITLTTAVTNLLTTGSTDVNNAIQSTVKLFNEFLKSKQAADTLEAIAQLGSNEVANTFPAGLLNLVQGLQNIPTGGIVQPSVGLPVVGGNFIGIGNIIQLLGSVLNGILGNNGLIGGLLGNNGLIGGLLGEKGLVGSLLGSNGLLGSLLGGLSLAG